MRTLLFILLFCGPLVHAGIFDGVFTTLASLSPFPETQHRNFSPKGAKPWAPRRPHQSLRPFPNLPIRTKEAEEETASTEEEINKIVDDEVVDDFDYLFDTEGLKDGVGLEEAVKAESSSLPSESVILEVGEAAPPAWGTFQYQHWGDQGDTAEYKTVLAPQDQMVSPFKDLNQKEDGGLPENVVKEKGGPQEISWEVQAHKDETRATLQKLDWGEAAVIGEGALSHFGEGTLDNAAHERAVTQYHQGHFRGDHKNYHLQHQIQKHPQQFQQTQQQLHQHQKHHWEQRQQLDRPRHGFHNQDQRSGSFNPSLRPSLRPKRHKGSGFVPPQISYFFTLDDAIHQEPGTAWKRFDTVPEAPRIQEDSELRETISELVNSLQEANLEVVGEESMTKNGRVKYLNRKQKKHGYWRRRGQGPLPKLWAGLEGPRALVGMVDPSTQPKGVLPSRLGGPPPRPEGSPGSNN